MGSKRAGRRHIKNINSDSNTVVRLQMMLVLIISWTSKIFHKISSCPTRVRAYLVRCCNLAICICILQSKIIMYNQVSFLFGNWYYKILAEHMTTGIQPKSAVWILCLFACFLDDQLAESAPADPGRVHR